MKRLALLGALGLAATGSAHDIWVEPQVTKTGEFRFALMLGNHGNHHRDFKLASMVQPADKRLVVILPKGHREDMTQSLKEDPDGYWAVPFHPMKAGLYTLESTFDKVMSYAPVRDVKSAKAYIAMGPPSATFSRPLGHALEIVPITNPIAKAGDPLRVRVLFKGKPLKNAKVSFIPRGVTLKGEFDPAFEKMTNAKGEAEIRLRAGDTLVATHLKDEKAKGKGYEGINYSATLFVRAEQPK